MTDWQRLEEEADQRACGNPALLGCVMLVLAFLGGIALGYLAWLWMAGCP